MTVLHIPACMIRTDDVLLSDMPNNERTVWDIEGHGTGAIHVHANTPWGERILVTYVAEYASVKVARFTDEPAIPYPTADYIESMIREDYARYMSRAILADYADGLVSVGELAEVLEGCAAAASAWVFHY